MKSKFLSIALCLSLTQLPLLSAEDLTHPDDEFQTKLELGQGFRQDHLKWSISGQHKKPNILSELDFKDVKIYMSTLRGILYNDKYKGELTLGYGKVYSGTCRDSDYFRNDRRAEFSRSYSRIPGSYNVDTSIKFGRIFPLNHGLTFTSSIGYATYIQKYDMRNGYQTILGTKTFHKNQMKISGLKSSYKARWSAPFVDFVLTVPILPSVHIDVGYTFYYPVTYSGHGYWNLRKNPGPNYTQKARASKSFGQRGEFGLRYACTSRFELGFKLGTMHFVASDGTDRWKHLLKTPFRKSERTSVDYMFTASYSF